MVKNKTRETGRTVEQSSSADPDEASVLIKLWRENPLRYFTQTETRKMFGIGEDSMKALVALGPPIVAKKINPDHFKTWLWENRANIQKLT